MKFGRGSDKCFLVLDWFKIATTEKGSRSRLRKAAWLAGSLACWLSGWLAGWLAGWPAGWLGDWRPAG